MSISRTESSSSLSTTDITATGNEFPSALQDIVAGYAFVDVMIQAEGDVSRVPEFLRPGTTQELNGTVVSLEDRILSSSDVRLFDRRMPHLREVRLSGSLIDGMPCFYLKDIKNCFPAHPEVKIVISIERTIKQHYIHLIKKVIEERVKSRNEEEAEENALSPVGRGILGVLRVVWRTFSSNARQGEACRQAEQKRRSESIEKGKALLQMVENQGSLQFDRVLKAFREYEKLYHDRLKICGQLITLVSAKKSREEKANAKQYFDDLKKEPNPPEDFGKDELLFTENLQRFFYTHPGDCYSSNFVHEFRRVTLEELQKAKEEAVITEDEFQKMQPLFKNTRSLEEDWTRFIQEQNLQIPNPFPFPFH